MLYGCLLLLLSIVLIISLFIVLVLFVFDCNVDNLSGSKGLYLHYTKL